MGLKINNETVYENGSFKKAKKPVQVDSTPRSTPQELNPTEVVQEQENETPAEVVEKKTRGRKSLKTAQNK